MKRQKSPLEKSECSDSSDSDYEQSEAPSSTQIKSEVMEPVTHVKARVEVTDGEKNEIMRMRQKRANRIRGKSKRSILFKQSILLGWTRPCNKSTVRELREFIISQGETPDESGAKPATKRQLAALEKAREKVAERKKKYGTIRIKSLHKEIYKQRRKQMLQKRLFDLQRAILDDSDDELDITILEEKPKPKRYRKPTGRPRGRPEKIKEVVEEVDEENETVASREDNVETHTELKPPQEPPKLIPPKLKLKRQTIKSMLFF